MWVTGPRDGFSARGRAASRRRALTDGPPAGAHGARLLRYGVLLAAQAAVGSAAVLARVGIAAGVEPLPLAAWRMALAWGCVALAVGWRNPGAPVGAARAAKLCAAGVCLGLHFVTWFASLEHISVARSALLVSTSPVWVGLGVWLVWRLRPPARFWWGVAVALCGVWAVAAGGPAGGGAPRPDATKGDAFALAGAVFIAAYFLLTQAEQSRMGTWRVVLWTYGSAAISLWVAVAVLGAGAAPRGAEAWSSVIALAAVPQLIGHTALNWSLRHFPAGVVGASTLLEPVVAAGLAWWLLSESVTGMQAAGAVVLLTGVWAAIRRADWGERR
ncbi:MAG TPA: DMT family transporter [Chthonomonadales bacterium]|nr:DMT family transporter [Chthonomonadales bacterium]